MGASCPPFIQPLGEHGGLRQMVARAMEAAQVMEASPAMEASPFSWLSLPFPHNEEGNRSEKLFFFFLSSSFANGFVPRVTFTVEYFPL